MDCALRQAADDAAVRERHRHEGVIVREHGDDHFAAARIGNVGCLVCTELEQRATLLGAAVEHGDIVSGLDEVGGHGRAHVAQADESDLHAVTSALWCVARCGGAMNSGPMGSVIALAQDALDVRQGRSIE